MSDPIDPERILGVFLAPQPERLPDRVIDAVLLAVKSTPQKRDLRIPRRFSTMPVLPRALSVAAVAIIAMVGGSAILLTSGTPGPRGGPTPSPSPGPTVVATPSPRVAALSPSINLDVRTWSKAYTSERFLYTASYPTGWQVTPANGDWSLAADGGNWLSPASDRFVDQQGSIGIHAWALGVRTGTADQWIDSYLPMTYAALASKCPIPAAEMPEIVIDGHPGKLADQPACDDAIAFVDFDGRMHVFTIGRGGQIPLFRAFLSTVRFTKVGSAQ